MKDQHMWVACSAAMARQRKGSMQEDSTSCMLSPCASRAWLRAQGSVSVTEWNASSSAGGSFANSGCSTGFAFHASCAPSQGAARRMLAAAGKGSSDGRRAGASDHTRLCSDAAPELVPMQQTAETCCLLQKLGPCAAKSGAACFGAAGALRVDNAGSLPAQPWAAGNAVLLFLLLHAQAELAATSAGGAHHGAGRRGGGLLGFQGFGHANPRTLAA